MRFAWAFWVWAVFVSPAVAQSIDLNAFKSASDAAPYDMTFLVENADGSGSSGWDRNVNDASADYSTHNVEFDSEVYGGVGVESWYNSPQQGEYLIWQDVEGVLPGVYRVEAYVVGRIYNDVNRAGECGDGLFLEAGGERVAITSAVWQRLSVECTVGVGDCLRVGIYADEENVNDWTGIADVRLVCIGAGDAEEVVLSENFDVVCVRKPCYADVCLKRYIPTDSYTVLSLPFDVGVSDASQFEDVLCITGAVLHGGEFVVSTERTDSLCAGRCYLVKGNGCAVDDVYRFAGVLVDPSCADTTAVSDGISSVANFRSRIGLGDVYVLADGEKTFRLPADPVCVGGYGGWLIDEGVVDMDAYENASEDLPYDMTFLVENADCSGSTGWLRNASDASADYSTHNVEFDSEEYSGLGVESWYSSPVKDAALIWQDVTGVLAGTYRVSAYVVGRIYNDSSRAGECAEGLYLCAGSERVAITSPVWQRLSVVCGVEEGEVLTIGIFADEDNVNDWTGIADVRLECIGAGE